MGSAQNFAHSDVAFHVQQLDLVDGLKVNWIGK
jgi:hypothetical protein